MSQSISAIGRFKKYPIDFSLIPIGIVILELAAFLTQFGKKQYSHISGLLEARGLHALVLIIVSSLTIYLCKKYKVQEFSYFQLSLMGLVFIGLADLIYIFIASPFGVDEVSLYRRISIGFIQAGFWFPLYVVIGSIRTDIIKYFKEYEKILIIGARTRNRTSSEFKEIQSAIESEISLELDGVCKKLYNSIASVDLESGKLSQANHEIQKALVQHDLRSLSLRLESFSAEQKQATFLGQNMTSVNLLIKQFGILYTSTLRLSPLRARAYALILLVSLAPAYINTFTLKETLIYLPPLIIAISLMSLLVVRVAKIGSRASARVVSLLILAIGLLPFVENQIGQRLTPNPNTVYPIYETAISLPLSYYAFMKALQILQVQSVETLKQGDLVASKALESAISQNVKDEFAHSLAHRWAIYIHGKILTRLAASALKLEMAAQVNDISTYKSTAESLKSLLSHPTSEFDTESGDLQSQIASRLNPWLGLLEVDLFIEPSLHTLNNHRVLSVGEVIEEIVSNSMRHGKAQKISLRVMRQGESDIQITAIDDGDTPPPEQPTRYGLGTTIFNLVSDGRWSITRVDSQTEFNLVMSIE
jgi:hypothetical protein